MKHPIRREAEWKPKINDSDKQGQKHKTDKMLLCTFFF